MVGEISFGRTFWQKQRKSRPSSELCELQGLRTGRVSGGCAEAAGKGVAGAEAAEAEAAAGVDSEPRVAEKPLLGPWGWARSTRPAVTKRDRKIAKGRMRTPTATLMKDDDADLAGEARDEDDHWHYEAARQPDAVVDQALDEQGEDAAAVPAMEDGASASADEAVEAPPLPAPEAAPRLPRQNQRRGLPWGPFIISPIVPRSGHCGWGAICGLHHDRGEGQHVLCKKAVSFLGGALTQSDCILRLKRWLVAGLDDRGFPCHRKRSHHVAQGGKHLVDFAEGLTERELDEFIAGLEQEGYRLTIKAWASIPGKPHYRLL